jgi:hypothetical protein
MKKIIFLLISFGIFGCDKIELPFTHGPSGNRAPAIIPTGPAPVEKVRKILIEDYTGHKCGNCPGAAEKLEKIQAANTGKVIGIAIHAGHFAETSSPHYTSDFATAVGDEWNTFFAIASYPSGMVNRKDYSTLQHIKSPDSWAPLVATVLSMAPDAFIEISNMYDASTRILNTEIKNEYLTAQTGNYNILVVITESGIVDYQEDYTKNPVDIPDYTFNHMLRGSMNGTWGDVLSTGAVAAGAKQTKNYSITLPAGWNAENCKVVAFVYNADTYEVMQAEEQKLIP